MKKIVGPVVPIPAPFNEDGSLDLDSLRSYVKWLIDNGIKNIMSTVGTSRFNLLSKEEVFQFNTVIAEECKDKALSIVANPPYGWQKDAEEFAKHSEQIGANVFLLIFPDRNYGDDMVYNYFKEISASTNIDIIIHEMPLRNGLGGGQKQYSLKLLDKLFEIDNVIGLKEEALDLNYSPQIVKRYAKDFSIVGAGGGMSRFLRDYWLGADTFLSGIANFYPKLELDFFDHMMNERFKEAYSLVHEIEIPYFQTVGPMGWHLSLKEALAHKGLFKTAFERKPLVRVSNNDSETIKKVMNNNGWL